MGMAVAGLAVAWLSQRIDRRKGILFSLALLAVPTALLAAAPSLAAFTVLRIIQGLLMASPFTLTLAYLAEHCGAKEPARSFPRGVFLSPLGHRLLFGRRLWRRARGDAVAHDPGRAGHAEHPLDLPHSPGAG